MTWYCTHAAQFSREDANPVKSNNYPHLLQGRTCNPSVTVMSKMLRTNFCICPSVYVVLCYDTVVCVTLFITVNIMTNGPTMLKITIRQAERVYQNWHVCLWNRWKVWGAKREWVNYLWLRASSILKTWISFVMPWFARNNWRPCSLLRTRQDNAKRAFCLQVKIGISVKGSFSWESFQKSTVSSARLILMRGTLQSIETSVQSSKFADNHCTASKLGKKSAGSFGERLDVVVAWCWTRTRILSWILNQPTDSSPSSV